MFYRSQFEKTPGRRGRVARRRRRGISLSPLRQRNLFLRSVRPSKSHQPSRGRDRPARGSEGKEILGVPRRYPSTLREGGVKPPSRPSREAAGLIRLPPRQGFAWESSHSPPRRWIRKPAGRRVHGAGAAIPRRCLGTPPAVPSRGVEFSTHARAEQRHGARASFPVRRQWPVDGAPRTAPLRWPR